jgi:hypothetical protein
MMGWISYPYSTTKEAPQPMESVEAEFGLGLLRLELRCIDFN